ncbi:solute carrier family 25 member 35-like [Ctenocephalides felis]|uniref:solute carrier family 25 member 35-like n=1 Tax=Ctenocephalides felis TaxID=7515 RepID=UPI000E6E1B96|nr:solute carrier family 25 member 35-like [Ctenocephalides felis]
MDFLLGGVAAMGAGIFSNPFDVIKTRMQLQGELATPGSHPIHYRGVGHAMWVVAKADGILALQKGLTPALMFQFVLNGTRLGLFQTLDNAGWTRDAEGTVNPFLSVLCGATCGVCGAAVGSPFYLIKTQIQAQCSRVDLAVGHQHQHNGGWLSALGHIYKKYGIKGLWRGLEGTIPRTAVASSAQLSTFGKSKQLLENQSPKLKEKPILCAFLASFLSGAVMVCCMTPFDVVSTRLYNQGVDSNGRGLLYKNVLDCLLKTWYTEGIRGLYKGFIPQYVRGAPHTVLCLVFWDRLKSMRNQYFENTSAVGE